MGTENSPVDVRFVVPVEPVAKARPRFGRTKGGGVRTWTPSKTHDFERTVALVASGRLCPGDVAGRPVRVDVLAVLPRPQRLCGRDRQGRTKHPPGLVPCTVKPDRDNLAKSVLDGIRHLLGDDSLVVCGDTIKAHAEVGSAPRVEVRVRTVTQAEFEAAICAAMRR